MWQVTIRAFAAVRNPGDWEINIIGTRWNLRLGRSQVALWRDQRAVVDWCSRLPRGPLTA